MAEKAAEMKKKGSKQEVFEGKAYCTAGGLKKEDLILNKRGSIVSKKRSEQGKKQFKNIEHLRSKKKEENVENAGLEKKPVVASKEEVDQTESEEDDDDKNVESEKKTENVEKSDNAYAPLGQPPAPLIENKEEAKIGPVLEEAKLGEAEIKVPKAPIKKSSSKKKSKVESQ